MKKLKVIQIIDSLSVGGAEMLAVNIANSLSESNIESHLCVTRKEGDLKNNIDKRVHYIFLNRKKTFDVSAILRLKKYIKTHQISIIHAHSTSSFIAVCIKILYPKVKVVWHNHTGNYKHLKGYKLRFLKSYSKFITYTISVNRDLDFWVKNTLKFNKGSYVPNFPIFADLNQTTKLKGIYNKRIVHVGGLRPVKDHFNLFEAFKIFKNDFPNWSLHLIGKDYEDSYSEKIKNYITQNNLSEHVFLYGVQSDIKNILSQARIGVLSSESEGLPISLLEYGLANIPVLVTDVGECKSVVNNKNAVVKSQDSSKFAKGLKSIVTNDTIEKQIKADVYMSVQNNYSKEKITKQLINIYHQIC